MQGEAWRVIMQSMRGFLLVLMGIALSGCAGNGPASHGPGDERFARMFAPAALSPNSNPGRYVEEIGKRLMAGAKSVRDDRLWPMNLPRPAEWMLRDVDFHLLESPQLNVFTAAGPNVYATTGMLRACRSEDLFAAALACGYAQLLCHQLPVFPPPTEEPDSDVKLALARVSFRYTPEQLKQADSLAILILSRAGWPPDAYPTMLNLFDSPRPRLSDATARIATLPPNAGDWMQPPVADRKRYAANQQAVASGTMMTAAPEPTIRRARLIVAAYPNLSATESSAQLRARTELQPPPPAPNENQWGKGLPPPRGH